jgi:type II secretory pathway predicted ATPase ExeA
MNATALLAYITMQLGAAAAASIAQNVRAIEVLLQSNAENGNHTVLILDEAHLWDSCDGLEIVRLLLIFEHSSGPSLTLLLAGQPSLLQC